jgi:hypothetical protein
MKGHVSLSSYNKLIIKKLNMVEECLMMMMMMMMMMMVKGKGKVVPVLN